MPIRACVILCAISMVFHAQATAQTWVTAWTAGPEGLSTTAGGALLTVEETVDPTNLWDSGSNTFASGGLTSASGSYQTFALDGFGVTLVFTLESGHVFDEFWFVDTEGDNSGLGSSLGTGTWTILESVAGTAGTAFLSDSDTTLNHAGGLIASAGVGGVNSFEITFDNQLEDSTIGIAYSVAVPEPAVGAALGLMIFLSLTRRRRQAPVKS